jgi:hypothetical protein
MMKIDLRTSFVCGALALVSTFAAVAPAEAAVYRGRFDPTYGAPFTSPALAWAGSVQITVDDSCVAPGTLFLLSCASGFQIDEAKVELYRVGDALDSENAPVSPRQVMDFGAAAGAGINGLGWLLDFDVNGDLTGVRSTAFTAIQGSIEETEFGSSNAYFSLQFLGDYAQLYWFKNEPEPLELLALTNSVTGVCRDNGVTIVPSWFYGGNKCGWSDPDEMTAGSFIRFSRVTEVPEPATYALVPAALAIMGFVGASSRRRRAGAAAMPK